MRAYAELVVGGSSLDCVEASAVAMMKLRMLLEELKLEPRDLECYQATFTTVTKGDTIFPCYTITCFAPVTPAQVAEAIKKWGPEFQRVSDYYRLPIEQRPKRQVEPPAPTKPRRFNERQCIQGHHYRALRARVESTLTYDEWIALRAWFDNKCVRCGASDRLVADHIVSMRNGGPNTIQNIQPLCKSCNTIKRGATDDYRDPARLAEFFIQYAQLVQASKN